MNSYEYAENDYPSRGFNKTKTETDRKKRADVRPNHKRAHQNKR